MNPLILAQEIIDGRRITREDDLSYFLTCDLNEYVKEQTVSAKHISVIK